MLQLYEKVDLHLGERSPPHADRVADQLFDPGAGHGLITCGPRQGEFEFQKQALGVYQFTRYRKRDALKPKLMDTIVVSTEPTMEANPLSAQPHATYSRAWSVKRARAARPSAMATSRIAFFIGALLSADAPDRAS